MQFAGAGHPPALIVRPGEPIRLLESQSAALGLLEDAVGHEATIEVPVREGDRVVIYTDGFTESFNPNREMLGVEGFGEIVLEASTLPLVEMKTRILERVATWRQGPAEDDMSLVLFGIP